MLLISIEAGAEGAYAAFIGDLMVEPCELLSDWLLILSSDWFVKSEYCGCLVI